jgi:purine-cytosine permease-like protein
MARRLASRRRYDLAVLALSDVASTIGLLAVFAVLFPALVHVLVGVAIAQVLGERRANQSYQKRGRGIGPSQG